MDKIHRHFFIKCPICKKYHTVEMTNDQFSRYNAWKNGEGCIQDMLYDISVDNRELLITGICPECWNKLFKEESKEEEKEDYLNDIFREEEEEEEDYSEDWLYF